MVKKLVSVIGLSLLLSSLLYVRVNLGEVEAPITGNSAHVTYDESVDVRAVLLEMNEFPEGWSDLPVGFINSERMQTALFTLGWQSDNMYVLEDNLTISAAQEAVEWLINNTDNDDVALLYIFTHGYWMRNVLHWNEWFPDEWKKLNTSRRVLLVDTCFGEEFIEPIKSDSSSHISLACCSADELSWAGLEEEGLPIIGSVWNYYFTNALCNSSADLNSDGLVSIEEAFNFSTPLVQQYMNETVFAVPEFLQSYHDVGIYPETYDAYPHPVMDDKYPEQLVIPKQIVVPDEFSTIQEAINSAVDGDTIFVKAGTYYEHVVVNKTVALVGEEAGTTIVDGNNTGHVIHVIRDNVTLTGFTVQRSGNIHVPELEAGICLNNSVNCVVSGNNLVDNGFCGISLLNSERNTIVDNNISRSSWGGIHLLTSSYNTVSRNVIDDTYGGINGHVLSNYNNFAENVITNSSLGMFYHNSNYNNISGNNISAISEEGIWLQDLVSYNVVDENNLVDCRIAIWLQGPNYNNTVSGNFISGAQYGIRVTSAQNANLLGNVIVDSQTSSDSWRAGIRLEGGTRAQVNHNVVAGNNYGILLYSNSPYVSVIGNNLTDNEFGIRIASGGSNYVTISDNFVANNHGYGIGITGFTSGSNYATISGNTIMNNSDGIALGQYSNQNTITLNSISRNAVGFYIEYSTQNVIYGNSIINNSLQVHIDFGSANAWDGGYTTRGNTWSDHFSWDIFSGPYQNETGSDGIGDAPYEIDENNTDHYPYVPYRLPADTNNDAYVGIDDLFFIASNFGREKGQVDWNPLYDINSDGQVGLDDIFIAACRFGDSA